jgi:chromosome segregation ATPase
MTSPRPAQGRQLKIGVTFLAWLNIYQSIKQIVQDAVAPEIQGLKGEIQGLKGEIKGLSDRIGSLEKRLDNRVDGLEKRMDEFSKRMDGFERQLEIAIEVRERLAAVEARLERR